MLKGMILSMTDAGGIGFEQTIPWHENSAIRKEDLTFFKNFTKGKAVVMGKNTWNSLPVKPLPNRINIVISQTLKPEEVNCYNSCHLSNQSLEETLKSTLYDWDECLVIGGAQLYNYALKKNLLDFVFIYLVKGEYECDTFINLDLLAAFESQSHVSKVETELGNSIVLMQKRQDLPTPEQVEELVTREPLFERSIAEQLEVAFHEGINLAINFFGNGLDEAGKQSVHTQILKYQDRLNKKNNDRAY